MSDVSLLYNIFARDAASPVFRKVAGEAEVASKGVGTMTKALGAFALVDIGAHAVKMAGDFQQETSVLVTAAGESQGALASVRKGIQDIAMSTGNPVKDLTDGMYQVEKAGFRGADGLKILKAASQASAEEGANLATVTSSITSVMRSYNIPAKDVVSVTNQLKTAAGESKTTMESFAGSLSTVLPVASKAGVSIADVLGALSGLTQHGTSAEEATQELANTIRNLQAPNNVASKAMGQLGINSQDVAQKLGQRGLTGTLNYLSDTVLHKMGPSGLVLLKSFNQSQTAGAALSAEMKVMAPATGALAKQFLAGTMNTAQWRASIKALPVDQANLARQFATTANQAHGFNASIKAGGPAAKTYTQMIKDMTGGANGLNTTLQLTGDSAPAVAEAVQKIADAAKNAGEDVSGWDIQQKNYNQRMKEFHQKLNVLMVTIGNGLMPVVTALVNTLSAMAGFIGRNKAVILPLVAVLATFATSVWAINTAVKAWAAVTRAQLALMALVGREGLIQTAIAKAQRAATIALTVAQFLLNGVMSANPVTIVVIAIIALVAAFVLAYKHCTAFRHAVNATFTFAKRIIQNVWNWVKSNWPLLLGILTGPIGLAVALIITHFHTILDFIKGLPSKFVSAIGDVASLLVQKGKDFIQGFINGMGSMAGAIASTVKDKVLGVASSALHGFGLFGSPSRLTMKYGKWFSEGFAIGIKDGAKDIVQKVQDLVAKLKEKLDAIKAFNAQIRDSFKATADVSGFDATAPGQNIFVDLQQQADKDKIFRAGYDQLQKMGLNKTTLGQLRDAGPGSVGAVQSLLAGGTGGVAQANKLVKEILRTGGAFADSETKRKYGTLGTGKQTVDVKIGKQHIHLHMDFGQANAENAFVEAMRKAIRVRGGNVQLVLGK